MKIYFDMDGTIADLYGVENWLNDLTNGNPRPYQIAKRMVNEEVLKNFKTMGYELGIISWLAKNGSKKYNNEVRKAKRAWLKENYPNIEFSEIHIVKYGTPKSRVAKEKNAILFDDEENNRKEWKGLAINASYLMR